MCLITPNKEPKIATKNITVYKYVEKRHDINDVYYISSSQSYIYKLGVLQPKIKMTLLEREDVRSWYCHSGKDSLWLNMHYPNWREDSDVIKNLICVTEGYHSLIDLDYAFYHGPYVVECKIPKGSMYYTDETGSIVSDQIIAVKEMENNIKYKFL